MRTDFSHLRVDQTAGEALEAIRSQPSEGRIIYFYVVDADNHLCGVVPTRRLLRSRLDTPIREIMIRNVVTLPPTATVLDACRSFATHRLLAFPVVEDGRILGVVDAGLYTDRVGDLDTGDQRDDVFELIGVHVVEAERGSPVVAFRSRFPWLMCSIVGGILSAFVAGIFESELQQAVALALFIPVVLAVAESVSIQSVSLALQVLHGEHPTLRSLAARLRREAATGALLGVVSAVIAAIVALVWLGNGVVVPCLLAGIAGGVTCAAVVGVAMPNLLRLLKRNPQVAAGPLTLVMADMATLLIYFNLARWLLG